MAFHSAEKVEIYTVTVNYPKVNFCENPSKTYDVTPGKTLAQVLADNEPNFIPSEAYQEEVAHGTAYTVTGTWTNQLVCGNVYRISMRSKTLGFGHSNTNAYRFDTANATMIPGNLWYFKDAGKTDDNQQKVTLHNLNHDDAYGIQVDTVTDNKAIFSTTPTTFIVVSNSYSNADGGFALRHTDAAQCHLDEQTTLGVWNNGGSQNSNGCGIRISALTDADFNTLTSIGASEETVAAARTAPTYENVLAAFKSHYRYQSDVNDMIGQLVRINVEHGNSRTLGAGNTHVACTGYTDANGALQNADASRLVEQVTGSPSNGSELWRIVYDPERCGLNQVMLQNVNANNYYLCVSSSNTTVTQTARLGTKLNITHNGTSTNIGEGQYIARINDSGNDFWNFRNSSATIATWGDSQSETGHIVSLIVAEEMAVTIPEGDTYATACFPVDVTVADDEAKVYDIENSHKGYGDANTQHYFLLRRLTGTIPAGTGFIVEGEGGSTVSFAIARAEEGIMLLDGEDDGDVTPTPPAPTPSLLQGITMKRVAAADATHAEHYTLAANGEMAKQTDATEIAANSAIVPVTALSATTHAQDSLKLTATDQSTGIASVAADGTVSFYDLQGRPVAAPRAGIYLTDDGRKVLVK